MSLFQYQSSSKPQALVRGVEGLILEESERNTSFLVKVAIKLIFA
jgi:hypothetical protein